MSTLTSIGQMTGLIGMAMFALNFILASRLHVLEELFGGINRAYNAHKIYGAVSFILLLFHPLFLIIRYMPTSIEQSYLSLVPSSDNLTTTFGTIGLISMMAFLALMFYGNFSYEVVRNSHKFLGLSFFLGGLHAFFIPSDISVNTNLKFYMLTLTITGLGFYIYRSVLGKFLIKKYEYFVDSVIELNSDVVEITMIPKNKPIDFVPGQFIFVNFLDKIVSTQTHPFTISSSCLQGCLRITVKCLGDYTSRLKLLKKGTIAKIEGPYGKFYSKNENRDQVWIAGGVGVTPFLSMAKSMEPSSCFIDMFYVAKNNNETICEDEFCEVSSKNKKFRFVPYYTQHNGRITAKIIENLSGGLRNKSIYLCGPIKMMQDLRAQFLELKVPKSNINHEEFGFL